MEEEDSMSKRDWGKNVDLFSHFLCQVCLVHDPRVSNAYGRLYTVEYLGNIVGGQKTLYNNQPIRVLKQAVYDSIAGDEVGINILISISNRFSITVK
jgi:aminopeptidase C